MNTCVADDPLIGFRPTEISALVNHGTLQRHAEEAAFLWVHRRRAIRAPNYSLEQLAALDLRLETHLIGLRLAGTLAWEKCLGLDDAHDAAVAFVVGALAFGWAERERMRDALNLGCASGGAVAGLISALGWLDFRSVERALHLLLQARLPAQRFIGISAFAIHRRDPGQALARAFDDDAPSVRARALRAAGELGRRDLLPALREHAGDTDPACHFWAIWAMTRLGDRDDIDILQAFALTPSPWSMSALHLGLRALPSDDARAWVRSLMTRNDQRRNVVVAVGVTGDVASVPWLIAQMSDTALAAVAGEAFCMITGIDLADERLKHDPSDEPDDEAERPVEYDTSWDARPHRAVSLVRPSAKRVADWWSSHAQCFDKAQRLLGGKPLNAPDLRRLLAHGQQRLRMAAALQLALLEPGRPIVEVRARGDRQMREAACIS